MIDNDPIDYSGAPQPSIGEQREHGFKIMEVRMLETYAKKLTHVSPIIRGAKLDAYKTALRDSFNVFRQIVERPSEEEITPG